jgi:hypothetical protein
LEKDIAEGYSSNPAAAVVVVVMVAHQLGEHQTGVITVEIRNSKASKQEKEAGKIKPMQQK